MVLFEQIKEFCQKSSYSGDNALIHRRILVMKLFSLAIFSTSLLMFIFAFFAHNQTFVIINTIVMVHTLHNLYLSVRVVSIEKLMIWATTGAMILLLVIYGASHFHESLFLWTLLFPLYAVSINGARIGLRFFVVYLVCILAITVTVHGGEPLVSLVRYILTLILAFFFAYYMEETSENEHAQLELSRKKLEEAHRDLQELTIRDPLTGLHNRRYLDDMLPLAISQSRRYSAEISVLMIDVDFFKKYNDHYGHQAGDEALRKTAQALMASVRRESDYVCRYGGEEFTIVLNKSSSAGVDECAQRIRENLKLLDLVHEFGIDQRLTVSIGAASLDQDGKDTVESLVSRADKALYEAKKQGRNRVFKM